MLARSFDGTRIFYTSRKKLGTWLVFLHHWTGNWTSWKKEMEYFSKKDYAVLALDLRGHGKSDVPQRLSSYTLPAFAADVEAVLRKENITECVLLGHSMGGAVALACYRRFPEKVRALVLCNTTSNHVLTHHPLEMASPFIGKIAALFMKNKALMDEKHKPKRVDFSASPGFSPPAMLYRGLSATSLKTTFACLRMLLKFDERRVLRNIAAPVLVLHGREDLVLPMQDATELKAGIKNADLGIIPGAQHFAHLEKPRLVNRYILSFLRKNGILAKKRKY